MGHLKGFVLSAYKKGDLKLIKLICYIKVLEKHCQIGEATP